MKIATWNVNSMAVRLPQALDWIEANRPDALCLQETKCVDAKFPFDAFRSIGYTAEVFGQPTYNGVAILSLRAATGAQRGLPDDAPEAQKRLIAATVDGVRIVNVYIPNGSEVGSEKYRFKLEWLSRLRNSSIRIVTRGSRASCAAISTSRPKIATSTARPFGPARSYAASRSATRSNTSANGD